MLEGELVEDVAVAVVAEAWVAELARVLRPGGRLVAVTYGVDHLAELWRLVGHRPLATSPFVAEEGGAVLGRHFDPVERRDVSGVARFPDATAVHHFLAAYGQLSEVDLAAAVGALPEPLEATYRHCAFVASRP